MHADDQEPGRPRTAILISGMHRSGTSAITRVVSLLGAGLPDDMIEAKGDNERGFWEGRGVIDLDEKALEKFGSWWGGWQSVDTERLLASRQLVEGAQELVRKEFRDADIIVLKDPRVSRLLPLWQQALEEEGFRCVHVVALRHPGAVADSLRRRNKLSPEAATLSWLAHTLDAEEHTREQQHVFVSFENLLRDWRSEMDRVSRALDIAWPEAPDAVAEAVDEFIEPDLAHDVADDGLPGAVSAVNPLYDVLRRWSARRPPARRRGNDRLLAGRPRTDPRAAQRGCPGRPGASGSGRGPAVQGQEARLVRIAPQVEPDPEQGLQPRGGGGMGVARARAAARNRRGAPRVGRWACRATPPPSRQKEEVTWQPPPS